LLALPWIFAITLFVSATLLFLVQPMIAKMILPKFGGTPAVWNTCMVFFQAALLAGYAYAHATPSWLGIRRQTLVHLGLLLLPFVVLPLAVLIWPFLVLPFGVASEWAPPGESHPVPWVLALLVLTVGIPFFLVSTSAPLFQKWFASTGHASARDPYYLYAASNLGSMAALLSYPFLIEPYLRLPTQGWVWAVGYGGLLLAAAVCAVLVWRAPAAVETATPPADPLPSPPPESGGQADETPGPAAGPLPSPPPETGIQANRPPPATEPDGTPSPARSQSVEAAPAVQHSTGQKKKKKRKKQGGEERPAAPAGTARPAATAITAHRSLPPSAITAQQPPQAPEAVTLARRCRWVALAFVPSSLMLGVTTYLTTDISAIPLLWIIPLSLYLLSFIFVFSQWFRVLQLAINGLIVMAVPSVLFFWGSAGASSLVVSVWVLVAVAGAAMFAFGLLAALQEFRLIDPYFTLPAEWKSEDLGHKLFLLAMPVAVLILAFMMLSGQQPQYVAMTFAVHLGVLFIVAMVCHGELARSRPSTAYLTEFYLWMSAGGVLGGLFNAILAPEVFTRVAEYPIALVGACLVLPALAQDRKSTLGFTLDVGVPNLMLVLAVGVTVLRYFDGSLRPALVVEQFGGHVALVAVAVLAGAGLAAAYVLGKKEDRLTRALDVGTAVALGVLTLAILHRPPGSVIDLSSVAERLGIDERHLSLLLSYGLPMLFCYIFVDQPIRFGLSVAAVFLAGTLFEEPVVHRERSPFGVLIVREDLTGYHTLVHGTTLHGRQRYHSNPELLGTYLAALGAASPLQAVPPLERGNQLWFERNEPLTYFHRTGPIGELFAELDRRGPERPMGVLGMGTGTLAAYALPGQELDFFEIDPKMVRLAEDPRYFTYLLDARARGVKVHVILGDGRLQIARAPDGKYGLLAMDAFASDSVPIHLITREAIAMYRTKLAPRGIILINIANRYLDLAPVLGNVAHEVGMAAITRSDGEGDNRDKFSSRWVLMARSLDDFGALASNPKWERLRYDPKHSVWTDDFSNLLETLMPP
jgi:hypothetical protein